jgi:3-hydroxyisobutyrate dehydrogenase-like beta-hydroxyacid dehydrogenase
MMTGDYIRDEPLFSVDHARKDARHMLTLASEVGVDMKAVKVVDEHLKLLKETVGPSGDLPGIYGVVRVESGLPYNNQEKK